MIRSDIFAFSCEAKKKIRKIIDDKSSWVCYPRNWIISFLRWAEGSERQMWKGRKLSCEKCACVSSHVTRDQWSNQASNLLHRWGKPFWEVRAIHFHFHRDPIFHQILLCLRHNFAMNKEVLSLPRFICLNAFNGIGGRYVLGNRMHTMK